MMKNATREKLVQIAILKAQVPFHGYTEKQTTNLEPIINHFPKWNVKDADGCWCAAFVYYCVIEAGFQIPYSPDECVTCSLAGCGGWDEFASMNQQIEYYKNTSSFIPKIGDIVIYDKLLSNDEHDHIGIIVKMKKNSFVAAEGSVQNTSCLIERIFDEHIRAYIRIPQNYIYKREVKR